MGAIEGERRGELERGIRRLELTGHDAGWSWSRTAHRRARAAKRWSEILELERYEPVPSPES